MFKAPERKGKQRLHSEKIHYLKNITDSGISLAGEKASRSSGHRKVKSIEEC